VRFGERITGTDRIWGVRFIHLFLSLFYLSDDMPTPFTRWSDEITTAVEPQEKAALLKEIAAWRAQNLTDLDGVREAAFAISRLLDQLGKRDLALREAQALVSLCQTKPEALPQMMEAAVTYVGVLGGEMRKGLVRKEPARRRAKPTKPAKTGDKNEQNVGSLVAVVMGHLEKGHDRNALKALVGKKGASAALLRTFVQLDIALHAEETEEAVRAVTEVHRALQERFSKQLPVSNTAKNAPPTGMASKEQAGAKSRGPDEAQLAIIAAIEAGADVETITPLLAKLRRRNAALKAAERLVEAGLNTQLETGVISLLRAMDAVGKPMNFLNRGQGLAIAVAAQSGTDGPAARYLKEMPGAEGFLAQGLEGVTTLSGALAAEGLPTFMVLHGTTKREREADEVLGTFGSDLGGLWRIVALNGRDRVEAWYLSSLTPAGQGAVARLSLDEKRPRVVVLDGSEPLSAWYATLGAMTPVAVADAGKALNALVPTEGSNAEEVE
jgi:hypothetical protein